MTNKTEKLLARFAEAGACPAIVPPQIAEEIAEYDWVGGERMLDSIREFVREWKREYPGRPMSDWAYWGMTKGFIEYFQDQGVEDEDELIWVAKWQVVQAWKAEQH